MNPKITARVDLNSLEPSFFYLRLPAPLTPEEIQKLTALGGLLKYDNGNIAHITIPPTQLEEMLVQLESVISVD